jgi:hypothetical protein
MAGNDTKSNVTVNLRSGPGTPAQLRAWRLLISKLIGEVNSEHGQGASR